MHLQKGLTLANGSAVGVAFNGSAPGGTGVSAIIVTSGTSPTSVSIGTGSGTPIDVNLSGHSLRNQWYGSGPDTND